jgi:hypothetical protein
MKGRGCAFRKFALACLLVYGVWAQAEDADQVALLITPAVHQALNREISRWALIQRPDMANM